MCLVVFHWVLIGESQFEYEKVIIGVNLDDNVKSWYFDELIVKARGIYWYEKIITHFYTFMSWFKACVRIFLEVMHNFFEVKFGTYKIFIFWGCDVCRF